MAQIFDYINLIEKFLNREISVRDFERIYLNIYLKDDSPMSEEVFEALDWLFAEVQMFTDQPLQPEDKPDHFINEDQLRDSARKTLIELQKISSSRV